MSKSKSDTNAISMLEKDHETVKALFDRFEDAEDSAEKQSIISEAIQELKIHATVEEEIFYPAIRKEEGESEVEENVLNEAVVEHHVARMLIAELDEAGEDEEYRNARFKVLSEAVRHHIKEEEGKMFPQAKDLDLDFDSLGQQMMERKEELISEGVPPDSEHESVQANPVQVWERTTVAGDGGATRQKSEGERKKAGRRKQPATGR